MIRSMTAREPRTTQMLVNGMSWAICFQIPDDSDDRRALDQIVTGGAPRGDVES